MDHIDTKVYVIPHQGTSFSRGDNPDTIIDMTAQDSSKPRVVHVSVVKHSGLRSPFTIANPERQKDYQINVKLDTTPPLNLERNTPSWIVCVPYNEVDTLIYGLGGQLHWDEEEQQFWSDSEVEPQKMSTADASNWG